ncbi:MAG: restriction endonuclease [Armatimonadetes bacterium]|nr:restriction endonuclease [Armatimonadota bacterium]
MDKCVDDSPSLNDLCSLGSALTLSPRGFEEAVADLFARVGEWTAEVTPEGADGGIDIWLYKRPSRVDLPDTPRADVAIVQCKQYNPHQSIGLPVIAQLLGIMHHNHVALGFFVTTAKFSPDAIAFADSNSIMLFDGARLIKYALMFSAQTT